MHWTIDRCRTPPRDPTQRPRCVRQSAHRHTHRGLLCNFFLGASFSAGGAFHSLSQKLQDSVGTSLPFPRAIVTPVAETKAGHVGIPVDPVLGSPVFAKLLQYVRGA